MSTPEFKQMIKLKSVLASSKYIVNLLNLTRQILEKFSNKSQEQFVNSNELVFLLKQMEKIHISQIEELLTDISNPDAIIALPITIQKNFTLFFVIVPKNQKFNWHDHPRMTGLTKCVHGKLKITSMDRRSLYIQGEHCLYPNKQLRNQILQSKSDKNLSVVYPDRFNIHKIEAIQLSAFFDLLMPDYPDDQCSFYNTIEQKQDGIILQKLQTSAENIKGFDVFLKQLSKKKIVQNIILKGSSNDYL